MTKLHFILGAADPEMSAIQSLLDDLGISYEYAQKGGRRAHPRNAYKSDTLRIPDDHHVVFVECAFADGFSGPHTVIDHHRPGDPGFGKPPEEFMAASSIGQVVSFLADQGFGGIFEGLPAASETIPGRVVYSSGEWWVFTNKLDYGGEPLWEAFPQDFVFAAAADHCLAAAYAGECPGVQPDALMEWRVKTRAQFQGKDPAELLAQVNETRQKIRELAQDGIADLTDQPGGTLPEAPEAASREGIAIVSRVQDRDGREKLVMMGRAAPEVFSRWLESQKSVGRETYGDPQRGFAGAYLA